MPGPISCRCGATWGGANRCHCSGCHETWSGVTLFDQHRWHRGERDGCWPPGELTTHGQPLVCRDSVWGGPELTEAQKVARFGQRGLA
jgi:hypothetical protein